MPIIGFVTFWAFVLGCWSLLGVAIYRAPEMDDEGRIIKPTGKP
jgi:hypothetical protein